MRLSLMRTQNTSSGRESPRLTRKRNAHLGDENSDDELQRGGHDASTSTQEGVTNPGAVDSSTSTSTQEGVTNPGAVDSSTSTSTQEVEALRPGPWWPPRAGSSRPGWVHPDLWREASYRQRLKLVAEERQRLGTAALSAGGPTAAETRAGPSAKTAPRPAAQHRERSERPNLPPWVALVTRTIPPGSPEWNCEGAREAIRKERANLEGDGENGVYDLSSVREWKELKSDPGHPEAMVGRLFVILGQKGAEKQSEAEYKARGVFGGNAVETKSGQPAWDLYKEVSSAPATMCAARAALAVGALRGWTPTVRDAHAAYLQSRIDGPDRPSTWIRLPKSWWPQSWFGPDGRPLYKDPVVRMRRSLYGHPEAGALWEAHLKKILGAAGWSEIGGWPGVYRHDTGAVLVAYVDDLLLVAPPEHRDALWARLERDVVFKEPPEEIGRYLGAYYSVSAAPDSVAPEALNTEAGASSAAVCTQVAERPGDVIVYRKHETVRVTPKGEAAPTTTDGDSVDRDIAHCALAAYFQTVWKQGGDATGPETNKQQQPSQQTAKPQKQNQQQEQQRKTQKQQKPRDTPNPTTATATASRCSTASPASSATTTTSSATATACLASSPASLPMTYKDKAVQNASRQLLDEQRRQVHEAFAVADKSGSGRIDRDGALAAMRALGFKPKQKDIKKMIFSGPAGTIGYEEFLEMMTDKICFFNANSVQNCSPDASADFAYSKDAQCCAPDAQQFIDQAARIVSPGGTALVQEQAAGEFNKEFC